MIVPTCNVTVSNYREVYNIHYSERIERDNYAYGSMFFRNIIDKLPLLDYDRLRFYFCSLRAKTLLTGKINYKILDIGCEDGVLSIALAKHGNDVIGVDVSDIAIRLAHENKKKFHGENVKFEYMDCRKLDFPNNYFDVIIGLDLIEHLHSEDVSIHLKEAKRVLKKGGYYFILTPNKVFHKTGGLNLCTYTLHEIKEILGKSGFITKIQILDQLWQLFFIQNKAIIFKAYKH